MTDKINYIFNQGFSELFTSNETNITQSSTSGTDTSNNIADLSFNTIAKTEKGFGEFIDLSFSTPIDVSNLNSIVIYSDPVLDNNIISKIRY